MALKGILAALVFVATATMGGVAQTSPSITLGLSTISLGEPATRAVSELARNYTVTVVDSKTPKRDEWYISEGSDLKKPVATLYARNGRVTGVESTIELFDSTSSQNGFNYFFALVGQLTKEKHTSCNLTNGTSFVSGLVPIDKKFVDFSCGSYYFYFLKNEYHDKDGDLITGFLLAEQIGETD